MEMFEELASRRTHGLGPNPIAFESILAFFELYNIRSQWQRETLTRRFVELDNLALSLAAKKTPKGKDDAHS